MMRPNWVVAALALCIAVAWGLALSPGTAGAQPFPFELRRHYRFLPRYSILNETGGIYPRDIDYRVFGTFDWRDTTVHPAADGFISFDNVEAWASHPILAYVLNLDHVLNLSGLAGYQLPVEAPFDVYAFHGRTQDGSTVNLWASVIGPWLHLRGGTTPPPGSADFFEYELRALARQRPFADFNANDAVDGEDLSRWMTRFGASPSVDDAMPLGDADGNHFIDGADFLTWQRQLGESAPEMAAFDAMVDAALATISASGGASVAAVPEPTSIGLAAVAVAGLLGVRRVANRRKSGRAA